MSLSMVACWMDADPIVVEERATLREAAERLACSRRRQLCVDRDGVLVGVLTESDFRRALPSCLAGAGLAEYARVLDTIPVGRAMTRSPVTVHPAVTMADAARRMLDCRVRSLPVVAAGRLMGLLTDRECLAYLLDELEHHHAYAGPAA